MNRLNDLELGDFPGLELFPGKITRSMYQVEREELISRWLIDPEMAHLAALWVLMLRIRFRIPIRIISGRRSRQATLELISKGRPAVLNSQHRLGNALDWTIDPEYYSGYAVFAGLLWTAWGRTWGGLFCRPDWNHIDGRVLDWTLPGYDLRISKAVESVKSGVFQWKSAC